MEEEEGSSNPEEDKDMRLSEGLRALFGSRKYVKESEITRAHLMRYLCGKGEITEVNLIHVSIQPFGGSCFSIVLDEQQNSVSHLKRAIQEQQGTPIFSQQLFLLGKSADDARGEPLGEENITSCSIAMCVLTNGKLLFTAADRYLLTCGSSYFHRRGRVGSFLNRHFGEPCLFTAKHYLAFDFLSLSCF